MGKSGGYQKLALVAIYWSIASIGSLVVIATTTSTRAHIAAAAGALLLVGCCRRLLVSSQMRKLRALSSAITNSAWGRTWQTSDRDPFETLLAACDQMFDGLADYHAERTAALDLINRLLACRSQADLVRVLKRSLRKVFLHDAGIVYLASGSREEYRRALSWRRDLHAPSATPPICFTIGSSDRAGGILALHPHHSSLDHQGRLLEHKRLLAEAIAQQIGLATSNLELRARLESMSVRDGLTGLHNRRYFDEAAARELEVARRGTAPLALVLFDIDHFKRINDQHGHRAGDAVLREIAQLLLANTRKSDILCRFGGEEFVLLMPNASAEQARGRAETLLAAARAQVIAHEGKPIGTVTLSAGVAQLAERATDVAAALEAADVALYAAKNAGRDRVACAAPPAETQRAA